MSVPDSAAGTRFALILLLAGGCAPDIAIVDENQPRSATEDPIASTNAAGTNLAGLNLGGNNLAATNLGGMNLGGVNLAGSNLAGSNLAGSNLGGVNLAGANLGANNLAGANLAGVNLAGTNLANKNLAGTNLSSSTLNGSTTGTYPGQGCPISSSIYRLGTDPTVKDWGRSIHASRYSASKAMLYSGEDLFTRSAACVTLGIGSTAMARLIAQNPTSATMYAAIGKLPWGVATSSGGAMSEAAWEVIVWGADRYNVFVVVSPPTTTWEGVAGFVKAIWRWQSTPAKTLVIGQIGGGKTLQTHAGMMGVGPHVLNAVVAPDAFIIGEAAFIYATTNNQTVNVDFASWIRKVDGTVLVLGDVAGNPGWAEGSFVGYLDQSGAAPVAHVTFVAAMESDPTVKNMTQLTNAYSDYMYLLRSTAPAPKRCGGALHLWKQFVYGPDPAGKCDSETVTMYGTDHTLPGGCYPMDPGGVLVCVDYFPPDFDLISEGTFSQFTTNTPGKYGTHMTVFHHVDRVDAITMEHSPGGPVLSQTYIHLNEAPYTPYP